MDPASRSVDDDRLRTDSPETIKAKNARFLALVDEAATEQVDLRQQQLKAIRLPYELR